jgi:hypothetical protein
MQTFQVRRKNEPQDPIFQTQLLILRSRVFHSSNPESRWKFLAKWDRRFEVSGVTITGIPFPHERVEIDENMVLTRLRGDPERVVAHLVVETEEGEDLIVSDGNLLSQERILDFVAIYSLRSPHEPAIWDRGASTMGESERVGDSGGTSAQITVKYSEEAKQKRVDTEANILDRVLQYFRSNEQRFLTHDWLRNALHYYYYAKTHTRLEDKVISLFVALESLLLKREEQGELRYRLSLRGSALLGSTSEGEIPKRMFQDLKELYDRRSGIVHGGAPKVTSDEVQRLDEITARMIVAFVSLSGRFGKENILQLVDDSLLNRESAEELKKALEADR